MYIFSRTQTYVEHYENGIFPCPAMLWPAWFTAFQHFRGSPWLFSGLQGPDLNANPGVWGGSRLDPAGFRCVQRGEP